MDMPILAAPFWLISRLAWLRVFTDHFTHIGIFLQPRNVNSPAYSVGTSSFDLTFCSPRGKLNDFRGCAAYLVNNVVC
jgi:hypothetical protein